MTQPEQMKYAETHEWVDWQDNRGEPVATIGISGFAIEQLNDIVFMSLPTVGKTLSAGDEFGEVESVKAVSPLYSPLSGEVVEVNSDLPNELQKLTSDPYDNGWLIKIRAADRSEFDRLLDFAAYEKQCAEGGH